MAFCRPVISLWALQENNATVSNQSEHAINWLLSTEKKLKTRMNQFGILISAYHMYLSRWTQYHCFAAVVVIEVFS